MIDSTKKSGQGIGGRILLEIFEPSYDPYHLSLDYYFW